MRSITLLRRARTGLLAAASLLAVPAMATVPLPTPDATPAAFRLTAPADGGVTTYFAGRSAGYTSGLGLLVNGVESSVFGLASRTTPLGAALDFGPVRAGDSLVFFIDVQDTGARYFSDMSLNPDGTNHAFAAPFGGNSALPAGLYLGFEDLPRGGDFDYNDFGVVVTNARITADAIPEPATWAMLIAGFGLVGLVVRRKKIRPVPIF